MTKEIQIQSLGFAVNASLGGDRQQIQPDTINLCKSLIDQQGYCLIQGLPNDFDVNEFFGNFGHFIPQYDGEYAYSVKSTPQLQNYSDSKSTNCLKPHTDGSDYNVPPHLLALLCLQPATCGGGQTLLADSYQFIASLDRDTYGEIGTRIYQFKSKKGIHAHRDYRVESPILAEIPGVNRPILRFSHNLLVYGDYSAPIKGAAIEADEFTKNLCDRLMEFFDWHHTSILLNRNDLLMWDNWRMVHSRNKYQDCDRHLLRYWLG